MTATNQIVDHDFSDEKSSLKDEITTSIPIVSLQETASSQHSSNDELATESSSLETELNSTIQKLTELDDPAYDRKRRAAAKEHGLQVKTLDKAVKAAKKDIEKTQSSFIEAVIPSADPIVPSDLFEEIHQVFHGMPYHKKPKDYIASEFKYAFTRYLAADTHWVDEGDF